MSIGIGGSTVEIELNKLTDMTTDVAPISLDEYQQRISKAQQLMREQNISALYLNAGTNLTYFYRYCLVFIRTTSWCYFTCSRRFSLYRSLV